MTAVNNTGHQFTFIGQKGEVPYPGAACGLPLPHWLVAVATLNGFPMTLEEAADKSAGWHEAQQQSAKAELEQMATAGMEKPRTFTRQEVNTVIRALKVEVDQMTERPVLERLRRIFEGME